MKNTLIYLLSQRDLVEEILCIFWQRFICATKPPATNVLTLSCVTGMPVFGQKNGCVPGAEHNLIKSTWVGEAAIAVLLNNMFPICAFMNSACRTHLV